MPLLFPQNPSSGETYQSGSSSTYEWTGTYWRIKGIKSPEIAGGAGIAGNPQTIIDNVFIPQNYNALLIGDVTVDEGYLITVGNNSLLKVLDI